MLKNISPRFNKNMKQVTQEQFNYFKKECLKFIDYFELNNYRVDFCFKEFKDNYKESEAQMFASSLYVATIFLNKNYYSEDITPLTNERLSENALHEVIHLLLARFSLLNEKRFVTEDEAKEAEEELVRKLQKLIKK